MGILKNILYAISTKKFLGIFKNQTVFPCYHLVRDHKVAHIENLYSYKTTKQFLYDLDVFHANYTAMHPSDLYTSKTLKNRFLLSFDDGLAEIYNVIYPILKEKNLSAVFFINPNFVDNKSLLYKHSISIIVSHLKKLNFEAEILKNISEIFNFTYQNEVQFCSKFINIKYSQRAKVQEVLALLNLDIDTYLQTQKPYISKTQIQEMMDAGFYFGAHTMNHPPLLQLSHEEQKKEVIDSIEWLKQNFGIDYSLFAFPFSDKSISKRLIQELFEYDQSLKLFGNSGLKKDIDSRIIQRFSLENPSKNIEKQIVTENLYKHFNQLIGNYNIKRK